MEGASGVAEGGGVMGTNYYLRTDACAHCGRSDEELHIGKSSSGWCFSLHVIPELDLTSLDAWREQWKKGRIFDEYGDEVTPEEMEKTITQRSRRPVNWDGLAGKWYRNESDFHEKNHSQRGPDGLLRSHIDGRHCVGHGDGTFDYIAGEFS